MSLFPIAFHIKQLLASAPIIKSLEVTSITLVLTKKNVDNLKINYYFWTHQRSEIVVQNTTLKRHM